MSTNDAASREMLAKSCRFMRLAINSNPLQGFELPITSTDYESKEPVCDEPQSQAGQGLLIVHTVREFADLRRLGQIIPQQEI